LGRVTPGWVVEIGRGRSGSVKWKCEVVDEVEMEMEMEA
jgi:hypothetical protein